MKLKVRTVDGRETGPASREKGGLERTHPPLPCSPIPRNVPRPAMRVWSEIRPPGGRLAEKQPRGLRRTHFLGVGRPGTRPVLLIGALVSMPGKSDICFMSDKRAPILMTFKKLAISGGAAIAGTITGASIGAMIGSGPGAIAGGIIGAVAAGSTGALASFADDFDPPNKDSGAILISKDSE